MTLRRPPALRETRTRLGYRHVLGIKPGMIFRAEPRAREGEQQEPRPWLVVSGSNLQDNAPLVHAVPLSRKDNRAFQGPRAHLPVSALERFDAHSDHMMAEQDSVVLVEQYRVIAHAYLVELVGMVIPEEVDALLSEIQDCLEYCWGS